MKALSKDQSKQKGTLIDDIRTAHAELGTAVIEYNAAMEKAKDEVQGKLNALNEKLQEAGEWVGGITSDMQSYYDEKSERWQESEPGQNYSSWKEDHESLSFDEVEIDFPEDLELPDCGVADELDGLSDEP